MKLPLLESRTPLIICSRKVKEALFFLSYLRAFEFPGNSCHDINCISSTNTNTDPTQATTIGGMGICADKHDARIGVVLKDNLRNRARFTYKGMERLPPSNR